MRSRAVMRPLSRTFWSAAGPTGMVASARRRSRSSFFAAVVCGGRASPNSSAESATEVATASGSAWSKREEKVMFEKGSVWVRKGEVSCL